MRLGAATISKVVPAGRTAPAVLPAARGMSMLPRKR